MAGLMWQRMYIKRTTEEEEEEDQPVVSNPSFNVNDRIFLPYHTAAFKGYTPPETAGEWKPIYSFTGETPQSKTTAQLNSICSQFIYDTYHIHSKWGIVNMSPCKHYEIGQNELLANYDYLTNATYTSGNEIDYVGFYYFAKKNYQFQLLDLVNQLTSNTQLNNIYKISQNVPDDPDEPEDEVKIIQQGHNLCTYYGTYSLGQQPGPEPPSIDTKDHFLVGLGSSSHATLTNLQSLRRGSSGTSDYVDGWYHFDLVTTEPFYYPGGLVSSTGVSPSVLYTDVVPILNYPLMYYKRYGFNGSDNTSVINDFIAEIFIFAVPKGKNITQRKILS